MRTTNTHVFFWNGIYSQWYASPFTIDGQKFNCAEQYMMYMKAMTFDDIGSANAIMRTFNPAEQKALGRKVRGYDDAKWREVARDIVTVGNIAKFTQNENLKQELLNTEDLIIVEASPYDKIWGIGLVETDPRCDDPATWEGTNWLGECIMNARAYIRGTP